MIRRPAEAARADALRPYVPAYLCRRLAARGGVPVEPFREPGRGAAVFVDVVGFTALTERLAASGPEGVERLSGILDACLGRLCDIITAWQGDVVVFAGDAILAIWPEADVGELERCVALAAGAALEVRREMHGWSPDPGIELPLRIAVTAGSLVLHETGGVHNRWLPLVAGDMVAQVASTHAAAAPGDVLLSAAAAEQLHWMMSGEQAGGGRVRLVSLDAAHAAEPPAALPELDAGWLRPYVPGVVRSRVDAGHAQWLAELRRVSILFVNLPGLDHQAADSLTRLHAFATVAQRGLRAYAGSVDQLFVDDKGTTLMAAFGLPHNTAEDDPARAVAAARAIEDELAAAGFAVSIGIATGEVFCGAFGSEARRHYTMIGSVINLASRLMQAVGSGVLCDQVTADRARARFHFEPQPPLVVKGRSEPVAVFRPGEPVASRDDGPVNVVGRVRERRVLREAIDAIQRGRGGLVVVRGEPGIGKSHLLRDMVQYATSCGVRALIGAGDVLHGSSPYHAWRAPLATALGGGDADHVRAALEARLAPDSRFANWAPLLGPVLGLTLPDNDVTRFMSGEVRAQAIEELVVKLIIDAVAEGPTLLVLNDAHWLDSNSAALAMAVTRDVPGLLTMVATRPLTPSAPAATLQLAGMEHAERVDIEPLDGSDVATLIARRVGASALPSAVTDFVLKRAEGNPFYSEELAAVLVDCGAIVVEDGVCRVTSPLENAGIPDSVHGVVTSRIDRLDPIEQLSLKIGSVIGRVFAWTLIHDVYPVPADRPRLRAGLDHVERLDLTRLWSPEPELAWSFKHAITRDVAYGSLLFAQRRQLHADVARWYERSADGPQATLHPLLAYHWDRADEPAKAIEYLTSASVQALRSFSGHEAEAFLRRALELLDEHPDLEKADRRTVLEADLAEAYHQQTEYASADLHFREAMRRIRQPVPTGRTRVLLGLLKEVLRQVAHRRRPGRQAGRATGSERKDLELTARAYLRFAQIAWIRGDRSGLLHAIFRMLNAAESAGSLGEMAYGGTAMAVILGLARLNGLADAYLARGLEQADRYADPVVTTRCYTNAIIYWISEGRWHDVDRGARRACDEAARVGFRWQWEGDRVLHGYSHLARGDVGTARGMFDEAWASASHGTPQARIWSRSGQVAAMIQAGEFAGEPIDDLASLIEEMPEATESITAHGLLALCAVRRGEWSAARASVDTMLERLTAPPTAYYALWGIAAGAMACLELIGSAGSVASRGSDGRNAKACCDVLSGFSRSFPIARPRAALCEGMRLATAGRKGPARRRLRRGLRDAKALGMPYDEALLRLELAGLAPDADRRELLDRCAASLRALGARHDLARAQNAQKMSAYAKPTPEKEVS